MKDLMGNEIQLGDLVVCVDAIDGFLTKDAHYSVVGFRPEENRVVIKSDDRGLEGWFNSDRFIRIYGRISNDK